MHVLLYCAHKGLCIRIFICILLGMVNIVPCYISSHWVLQNFEYSGGKCIYWTFAHIVLMTLTCNCSTRCNLPLDFKWISIFCIEFFFYLNVFRVNYVDIIIYRFTFHHLIREKLLFYSLNGFTISRIYI